MMSAIPVKLHRVGWCFAPTAHTSVEIQLNENWSCSYNNARLFFLLFIYFSAIAFNPSSWVCRCLVVTSTELCQALHFSSPLWPVNCFRVGLQTGFTNPSTHQRTNWRWPTTRMLVRLRWIEVEPSASETNFSTPHWMMMAWWVMLTHPKYSAVLTTKQLRFEVWTWQVDRWWRLT